MKLQDKGALMGTQLKLTASAQPHAAVRIDAAGHGFNCDQHGSYDESADRVARARALGFFNALAT